MSCSSIHHIEMCVKDATHIVQLLVKGLGFTIIGHRTTKSCKQFILKQNNAIILVTERKEGACCRQKQSKSADVVPVDANSENYSEEFTVFCCRDKLHHSIDSVFNAAFIVTDISAIVDRVQINGGIILKPPTILTDGDGKISYAIVATGVGNIVHTLIDNSKYNGIFLPGFEYLNSAAINGTCSLVTHFDHIALVCGEGESSTVIGWYEQVFGMKRFFINSKEDVIDGLTIEENVGLRLKALEYWKCFETGVCGEKTSEDKSLKVIIVEPITKIENNHVSSFLECHGGPGIQHVALHCPDLLFSVDTIAARGVPFRHPPPQYYTLEDKLMEMMKLGLSVDKLQKAGILLDTEADFESNESMSGLSRYLMQIFSEPIFGTKTFFLELIHRAGAEGFGVGNITALARSIAIEQNQPLKQHSTGVYM